MSPTLRGSASTTVTVGRSRETPMPATNTGRDSPTRIGGSCSNISSRSERDSRDAVARVADVAVRVRWSVLTISVHKRGGARYPRCRFFDATAPPARRGENREDVGRWSSADATGYSPSARKTNASIRRPGAKEPLSRATKSSRMIGSRMLGRPVEGGETRCRWNRRTASSGTS